MVLLGFALVAATTACRLVEQGTGKPVKKVIVVGDSVMYGAYPDITNVYAKWKVDVHFVGLISTGPLWNQKQWATMLRTELSTFPADLVVFEACCSYPGGRPETGMDLFVNSAGVTVQPDTELMYTEWEQAERELIQIARDAGASPYWVKLPPGNQTTLFYGPTFLERIDRFNAIVDTLGVPVLDWGGAVMAQPNVDALRYGDGIHYTAPGYAFLANFTFKSTVKVA